MPAIARRRPRQKKCDDAHLLFKKFNDGVANAIEAAERLADMPDEQFVHNGDIEAREEAIGALWTLRHALDCVEGSCLSECWSKQALRTLREYRRNAK